MKFKYYLRGVAIGVIVTVIIMAIAFNIHEDQLTDEEVIQRAQELGMQMSDEGVIADKETESEGVSSDNEAQSQESSDNTQEETSEEDDEDAASNKSKSTKNSDSDDEESKKTITVKITNGNSSDDIALQLYSAGVVDDASDFNDYLIEHGYDSSLRTGTFTFEYGASYAQVAKVLIRK